MADMSEHRPVDTWLTDMDGVLVHEEQAIPGAQEFVAALRASVRSTAERSSGSARSRNRVTRCSGP